MVCRKAAFLVHFYFKYISMTVLIAQQFVLFADDTNIFVSDSSYEGLVQKANDILTLVSSYMFSNNLAIFTLSQLIVTNTPSITVYLLR